MQPVANSSFNVEADQLKTYIEEMNGRKPMAHIRSLPSLDKLIGGVVPGILTIVGAAPAAGKTTLLKTISDDLASQGVPTSSIPRNSPRIASPRRASRASATETSAFPRRPGPSPRRGRHLSTPAPSTPRP